MSTNYHFVGFKVANIAYVYVNVITIYANFR